MDDVQTRVLDIVAKQRRLDRASLRLDQRLEDINVESIDLVEIIFAIEDEFDVNIPQRTGDFPLETLGDVAAGVERLVAAKQPAGAAPPAS